ncbi:MAG: response regulator [Deltaproteobacteria bacterium]|nr:response regulator [Deltaproteobacteria bacterium]
MLAILPSLAIIAVTCVERYSEEAVRARAEGDRIVRTLAKQQNEIFEVMAMLAQVLARVQTVRAGDAPGASALFQAIADNSPEYHNILLLDGGGAVIAAARPLDPGVTFASCDFFTDARSRNSFSVGAVAESPVRKKPVIYFAMPLPLEDRAEPLALVIAFTLSRYDATAARLELPEGATVYFLDNAGSLVSAYPKLEEAPAGDPLADALWRALQEATAEAGFFALPGDGGQSPLQVSYRKLFRPGADLPYLYILHALRDSSMFTRAKVLQTRDIAISVLVILFTLAATVGLCHYAVRRPWRRLLAAAQSVAKGELEARVSVAGVGGEIGMISMEFNAMAQALAERDKEISAARDYAELSRNSKSEFLANRSHEIRTSMNAILGMAYLVLKTELTAQQKGYVTKLLTAANGLLHVINDILDFSKIEAGKLTMERINFSLRRILTAIRSESAVRLNEKNLGFDLQIAPGVPDHLIGDSLRLSQALMILMEDAVNRSERGAISLRCAVAERGEKEIRLQFAVHDAGVGFTPVQLLHLGELFEKEDADVSSSMDKFRLRLAIGNRLFRMMGGRIEASGEFGVGGVFTAEAKFGFVAGDPGRSAKFFEGKKALIVDSGELSRQDLMEILPQLGFTAEYVDSPGAARKRLCQGESADDPFAVIFVDWKPSLSTIPALMAELKTDLGLRLMPPVILTAVGRAEFPESPGELDIDALLPKPFTESVVLDTLMNILAMKDPEVEPEKEEAVSAAADLAGMRVLLAEDNSVNQLIAVEILESAGITVTVAGDGEEAVTLLSRTPDSFDLVLMDLQMPKMDGFAATSALRSQKTFHPLRLPIIAMTANSDASEVSQCLAGGMNDHTAKPINLDTFFATLKRWRPVRKDGAEKLLETARDIRALAGKTGPESLASLNTAVQSLTPVLHAGRVEMLRAVLLERESQAMEAMVEALTALARGLPGEETP